MRAVRIVVGLAALAGAGALLASAMLQWGPSAGAEEGASADPPDVQAQIGERVRVEVLNAGGRADMARRATDLLRNRGFDVVYFGNAESFDQETSRVLDRVGRVEAARAVAGALGIEGVASEPDRNLFLDVTVRLGSDWEPEDAVPTGVDADADSAAWWDPREMLRELSTFNPDR